MQFSGREREGLEEQGLGLSKIWLFSRNPQDYIFSHGFNHEEFENDDNFAVRVH